MKTYLALFIGIVFSFSSIAQCDLPEAFDGNTGGNMTVMLTPALINSLNLTDDNAYLVALNSSDVVIGSAVVAGFSQTTIAIWGDDTQTPQPDGAFTNELIKFQLVNGINIYDVEMATPVTYVSNGLNPQTLPATVTTYCMFGCTSEWAENYNADATDDDGSCYLNGCMDQNACNYTMYATADDGSCTIPGCTDNTFTEYYHQGYVAGCDDGSCSKATANLGIEAADFSVPENTGSNMTIGFNLANKTGLEGSQIGVFSDLNNDGTIDQCVGLSNFTDAFFSLAVWGDDATSPEAEGLTANQTDVIFAVLNASGSVMAFNPSPEFSGFVANGLSVVTELDFNVTIYGCMDPSYCNYNDQAEEDDGSCAGTPGCIDNDYLEYDATASCNLVGACVTTWQNAYVNEVQTSTQLQLNLEQTETAAAQAALEAQNVLNATVESAELEAENAAQALSDAQAAAAQAALEAQNVLNATVESAELQAENAAQALSDAQAAAAQAALEAQNVLNATVESAELEAENAAQALSDAQASAAQAALEAQNVLDNTTANFDLAEEGYLAQINELSAPIIIDIVEGWNTIGYTRATSQDVVATFDEIVEYISIVKNNDALVYWPEFGFNGIGDLIPGQGYQLKVTQAIDGYFYPDTQGERIYVSPTVPEWAIALPAELHPNDVRSLVKVVNLFGQEVTPETCNKGTTLIYLYSDASVEKKIK
jgi:hypothetical protein